MQHECCALDYETWGFVVSLTCLPAFFRLLSLALFQRWWPNEILRERRVDPNSVAVLPQFRINAVATGLTFPAGVTFDNQNRPCVVESGYAYGEVWTKPRLVRLNGGRIEEIAAGGRNGPWTGVTFHEGNFYVAEGGELEGGRILKISQDGKISVLVSNLPSFGDHHTDGPVVGPDGFLYFGQGTASNSGIVGEDNSKFGWLKRHPDFHDFPGQDIVLTGENVSTKDFVGGRGRVKTGAFLPFGTPLTDKRFKTKGGFLIKNHPNQPPRPVAAFGVHASADGFDFSRNAAFGYQGQAFVALFGDEAPAVGKVLNPVGAKVVRVNLENGVLEDFAVNRGSKNGPASKVGGGGLERPVAARFNPAGDALYVVDFGVMMHSKKGAKPVKGTGVLWRIAPTANNRPH